MRKLTLLLSIFLAITSFAQVPNYVPTNGLVGWWPFNGNANDESGNGNNGTVNGATLVMDRNLNSNSAYFFNHSDEISTSFSIISNDSRRTFSFWMKNQFSSKQISPIWYGGNTSSPLIGSAFNIIFNRNEQSDPCNCWPTTHEGIGISADWIYVLQEAVVGDNQWHNWVIVTENLSTTFDEVKYYKDGVLLSNNIIFNFNNNGSNLINTTTQNPLKFGKSNGISTNPDKAPTEFLDDIGIWNRALTDCEIKNLYNGGVPNSSQTQTALDTYTWPVNNQTYTQSGTYSDTLVNAAGCDSIVTLNLTLSYTGINELNTSQLVVSPNPTKDNFSISGLELLGTITSLEIKDAAGKVVKVLNPTATNFSCVGLKAGIYFLAITSNKTEQIIKIIKE
jgi:hypothetical protein